MDLTFLDRSTKVLSQFASAPTACRWTRGTIDSKPASPRSVALEINLKRCCKLLFRKAFVAFASPADIEVVCGEVFRFRRIRVAGPSLA